jgi:hypothetical protein
MRRFTLRRVAPGAFAFLTSGFALAQAPTPPAAPAPTTPPAAPAPTPPPASPPAAAPAAPAPGTAPAAPAPGAAPAPTDAPKTEAAPAPTDSKPAEAPAATVAPAPAPAGATAAAPATAAADAAKPQEPVEAKDDLARPGYIPGYRRYPWIGLPPYVPHSASAFGHATAPYGSQGPRDVWNFNFSGFFAAGVRAAIRQRPLPPGSERDSTALRNAVQTGEPFSAGGTQGSWVQMTFEYGNRIATAHVNLTTWNPSRGASFTQLGSQNFIDSAYLTFRIPPISKLRLGVSVGAFGQTYGNLGQYGGGFYNNATGQIRGVGETVSAEYDLTDTLVLTADHGIMSNGDKAPGGCETPPSRPGEPCPTGVSFAPANMGDAYDPASWVHHMHLGIIRNGDITIQGQLHYLQNWSQDDRGLLPVKLPPADGNLADYDPDPRPETPYVDESRTRGDGRYDAYGASIGFRGGQWARGGVGVVYGHAENAYALHGLSVSYVGDGETFSRDWLGPRSLEANTNDLVGSITSFSGEAEFSWGTLWRLPEPYWGEGFNVTTGVGFQYGVIGSEDPERDGWNMYRAGIDSAVSILPWLGAGVRVDQVNPNLERPDQIFYALTARLVFRTWWNSHESVTLQYNKWIYGDEVPINFRAPPNEKLDTDALSFGFGMWW